MRAFWFFPLLAFLFSWAACDHAPSPAVPAPAATSPAARRNSNEQAVAHLWEPVSDVQVRASGDLIWKSASDGMELRERDVVKTGRASTATIHFSNGSDLRVDELSLVVVLDVVHNREAGSSGDLAKLLVPEGRLQSKLHKTSSRDVEMEIRTRRGWLRASTKDGANAQGEVRFAMNLSPAGKLEVDSEEGKLVFETKSGQTVVSDHRHLTVQQPAQGETADQDSQDAGSDSPPDVEASAIQVQQSVPRPLPAARAREALTKGPSKSRETETRAPEQYSATTGEMPPAPIPHGPAPLPPPEIGFRIYQPANHAEVSSDHVKVSGIVEEGRKVVVNGVHVRAGDYGNFELSVPLHPGANQLKIEILGPLPSDSQVKMLDVIRN